MASKTWRRAWPLFAAATVFGLGFLVQWPLQAVRDYRTLRLYEPTVCTVLATRTIRSRTSGWIGGRTFAHDYFLPEVTFRYEVDGRSYTKSGYDNYDGRMSANEAVSFEVNARVPCWYDPAQPEQAVVARSFSWAYYGSGVIPLVLTLIPANFLLVALRTRPRPVKLSTSAGSVYAVRLSPEFTNREALVWRLAIAILLCAGLLVYVGYAVQQHGPIGAIDHFGFFFLLFAAGDGYVFWLAWQSLRVARLPNPTIEVDREPARPGEPLSVAVGLPGPLTFRELKVTLVCERRGPRRSATPVRHRVLNEAAGTVVEGGWLTRTATVEIPADAEPSESDGDRLTTWTIVVRLKTDDGASLMHEFPFRVLAPETPA
jgi:hypothetical protein